MILFFGTRSGKERQIELTGIPCPHCRNQNTLKGRCIPQYLHLFWIPLFKLKTHKSIGCIHCKAMYYGEEFNPAMTEAMEGK
jgi:hypothetical protein